MTINPSGDSLLRVRILGGPSSLLKAVRPSGTLMRDTEIYATKALHGHSHWLEIFVTTLHGNRQPRDRSLKRPLELGEIRMS